MGSIFCSAQLLCTMRHLFQKNMKLYLSLTISRGHWTDSNQN